MANEISISAVTGLTLTIQLYNGASPVGSPFSAVEIGGTGEYIADMPLVSYGRYIILVTAGALKIASGEIMWDGNYELVDFLSKLEGLDPANPMRVTPSSRVAGGISLAITGDGETETIVTR